MLQKTIELTPQCNRRLATLTGQYNEHFKFLAAQLGVKINQRGFTLQFVGDAVALKVAKQVILSLYEETRVKKTLTLHDVHLLLQVTKSMLTETPTVQSAILIKTPQKSIRVRSENQASYLRNIEKHDINFGIGPAGTGKTYLAVAMAVNALQKGNVKRILLVRPAVEAGENLGFLPGDLSQKVDPYLRPLFDGLYEMLGGAQVDKMIESNIIEVAPLAYMRGRTLSDAFIILDESQNTTVEQMKMFLTRIGFGSKAVITGDITQVDLQAKKRSGLKHAISVLSHIEGISFNYFQSTDVVRHALVQQVIEAYEYAG